MTVAPDLLLGCWAGFALYTFGSLAESMRLRWWALPIVFILSLALWPLLLGVLHARRTQGG